MKLTSLDRGLLLLTVILASYQVAVGIDGLAAFPIMAYTISFGVILVAGLLLFILGFDVLDSPIVVLVSTVIPLSLATGLVWQHLVSFQTSYLVFAILGFLAVVITRSFPMPGRLPTFILTAVHGIAGITIFVLPILTSIEGQTQPLFSLVGVGGALMGISGLLLSLQRMGRQILSRATILKVFPGLLLLATVFFVAGFKFS